MVVQPGERNSFDQRWLEFALFESHGIKLLRRSLAAIDANAEFRSDRSLLIDGHQVDLLFLPLP
jgi:glutathione synthase